MEKARLRKLYETTIRPELKEQLGVKNIMQVPHLKKIVLNVGVKEAVADLKELKIVEQVIGDIAGQRPVRCEARKSIASFKLREGRPIGVMVTLRGQRMYEFLDRLINLALPNIRDFQGVSKRLDGRGNYNLGITEWTIFSEVGFGVGQKIHGLNITMHTSAKNDAHGIALLERFGVPFRR